MSPARRVLIVFNPTSGSRRRGRLHRVIRALEEAGAAVDLRVTEKAGDAEVMAREGAGAGCYDVIAAAGGDGTIDEVANGLGPDAPPLGIVPLGTANVLAAEIGLARSAGAIARTLLEGERRVIHCGRANGHRFLIMAGAGLDAEVVAALDPNLKRRLGKFSYVIETTRQMFRYRYPVLDVTLDGGEVFRAITAVACKGRRYGGPYLFAPGADLARPEFEVVLFDKGGAFHVALYGIALVLGLLPCVPGVRHIAARSVTVSGPNGAPVQGDGDCIARLPLAIAIDPVPLTVLYPPRTS
ncbi:MAG: diacylglycerol kinase family protein [Alphaproteobacteria bacterium]